MSQDSQVRCRSPWPRTAGFIGDESRYAGRARKELVDIPQHRSAAGEYHSFIHDIGRQFGRGFMQHIFGGGDDPLQLVLQGFRNVVRSNRNAARQAGQDIAPADLHG